MKKIQEEKIIYLRKLLKTLILFSRHYTKCILIVKNKTIEVKWCNGKPGWIHSFESLEFNIEDLETRITHYKIKLNNNFVERNKQYA